MNWLRAPAHLWRLGRALATLRRTGALDEILREAGAPRFWRMALAILSAPLAPFGHKGDAALPKSTRALSALSPGYIKLGQALSTRADIVGQKIADDLKLLQDRLAPFPMEAAQARIAEELGRPASAIYAELGPPVAAASIAQVHRAKLHDGRDVAVKILRPGVERAFMGEIEAFRFAARLIEAASAEGRRLRPGAVIDMLADSTRIELDLRMEAAAAAEFAQNTARDAQFRLPEIVWPYTARRVMTLEWVTGDALTDRAALEARGVDRRALAAHVVQSFLRHALRDGFFHADMHQGNLRLAPDGALIALDFGIMGRLDGFTRRVYAEILLGFVERDYMRAAKAHLDAGYVSNERPVEEFAQALRAIGEPVFGRPAADFSTARMLAQMFQVTEQFGMETQPQLILLQKTMLVVEGVARDLDPDFNMWEVGAPVLREWITDNLGPQAMARDLRQSAVTLSRIGPQLPVLAERLARLAHEPEALSRVFSQEKTPPAPRADWRFYALAMGAGFIGALIFHAIA